MKWTEIGFTVDTPMFLRGADRTHAEFRLPSLRGALRFWFRALAGLAFADDLAEIHKAEADIFGSAGDGASGVPSSLLLRKIAFRGKVDAAPAWLRDEEIWVRYLLGPGLHNQDGLQSEFIPEGSTGTFGVRFRPSSGANPGPDHDAVVGICLAALSLYGGLGARTRRGFGAIRFDGLEALCQGIDQIVSTADEHRLFDRFATALGLPSVHRRPVANGFSQLPSFSHWTSKESQQPAAATWNAALHAVGKEFRAFRAPEDRSQLPYNRVGLDRFHKMVTREYVEVVYPQPAPPRTRPATDDFLLAAFGLPIIFKKDGPMVTLWRGDDELRRASPLWIRPRRRGNRWIVVCHVFRSTLWSDAELELRGVPPVQLTLDEAKAYAYIDKWLASPKW